MNKTSGAAVRVPGAGNVKIATGGDALQQRLALRKVLSEVPKNYRKIIAREALRSQTVFKSTNYYSTVRFAFDVVAPPAGATDQTYSYRFTHNKLAAFSYGVGDDGSSLSGFPKDFSMTELETNLKAKNDTNGATLTILGISLYPSELSDGRLTPLIWANTIVDITLDGSQRHTLLGRMGRIPGAGGLYGTGDSYVTTPDFHSSVARVGNFSNGVPSMGNVMKIMPIKWNPTGKTDSRFQVRFEVPRDLEHKCTARDAATGAVPFRPPTTKGERGTFVDVTVYLHVLETMPRSTQG